MRSGCYLRDLELGGSALQAVVESSPLLSKKTDDSFRQPDKPARKWRIQKSGMSSLLRKFQSHCCRNLILPWQCRRWHERVVEGIYDKRGHLNMLEPWLAAGSIPIILRISEAVQRCSHKIIEFIKCATPRHCLDIKEPGEAVQFFHRLAL